jgi:vacuolar-type H+-ATPase subunit I/STV1
MLKFLKGKDKLETAENFSIAFIVIGAGILSLGIGLTVITPKGIPAILAMLGAFISFVSTVALIFVWLIKEFREE